MLPIVLKTVSPEELASSDFSVRLRAEKTMSYNAGILYALEVIRTQVLAPQGLDNLLNIVSHDTAGKSSTIQAARS
jgi:hypothetical protein